MVKPTDSNLNTILASRQFYTADLITLTLQNGSTLRYCSGTKNIVFNGSTYTAGGIPTSSNFGGPYWDRKDNKAKVIWRVGSGNDSLTIDVIPGAATLPGASTTTVTSPDIIFDGSSDSFYSSTTVAVINAGGGALTFSAWFKSTMTSGGVILAAIDNRIDVSTAVSFENAMYIDTSGLLRGGWFDGGTKIVVSSAAVNDGNWHHGAVVILGSSNVTLYVDSTKSNTIGVGTLNTATPQLWIADGKNGGAWTGLPTSNHNIYTGKTADIRVYNRALSSAEITTLFNGSNPSSASISGEYNSTAGTDTSGAGHNLTVVNTPTAGTDGPAVFGSTVVTFNAGMSFNNAIRVGMFDNADFLLQRAFMTTYGVLPSTFCAVTMFQGLVGSIDVDRAVATFQVDDYRILFNQKMPKWLFAPTCQNTLYDANCTLSAAANASSGTISNGSTLASIVSTSLTSTGGWFDNGKITWLTGPNAGIVTTVSSYSTSPNPTLTLTAPLPFAPSTTDTFQAFPGCDRSTGTGGCSKNWASTGSNIVNFRGMPYIPDPETVF